MGRRMSTKYPHVSDNKPYSEETVQSHLEVISESLSPATRRMQLRKLTSKVFTILMTFVDLRYTAMKPEQWTIKC
jgi:hypothetical protein